MTKKLKSEIAIRLAEIREHGNDADQVSSFLGWLEKQVASEAPKHKVGQRLPADWVLTIGWAKEAARVRVDGGLPEMTQAELRLEAGKFKDFWTAKSGKDASKLDWLATWRNWIRSVKVPLRNPVVPESNRLKLRADNEEAT